MLTELTELTEPPSTFSSLAQCAVTACRQSRPRRVSPPLIEARRLETLWVEDDAEMFLPRAKQPAGSVLLQVEYPELRVPRDLEPDLDAISPSLTICSTSLIRFTNLAEGL